MLALAGVIRLQTEHVEALDQLGLSVTVDVVQLDMGLVHPEALQVDVEDPLLLAVLVEGPGGRHEHTRVLVLLFGGAL